MEPMSRVENYLDYVAHRPGVQTDGEHGLWNGDGKVRNLSQAVREVAEHTGNVWTPVVAIRREDAERLGYDTAESWRALVYACLPEIARGYKIPLDHLRWYAAFHRKEHSAHIHLVLFSTDPKEGYRRVVASPKPQSIIEIESIRDMVDAGLVVVACGGGGIPVYKTEGHHLKGAAAVIDKDFASCVLAQQVNADTLIIQIGRASCRERV